MKNQRYPARVKKHSKTIKKRLVSFDPNISAKKAVEILREAKVEKYALIGGVVMWVHVEDDTIHQFTKDLDIAVPYTAIGAIEQVIQKNDLHYVYLHIGGLGIRENGICMGSLIFFWKIVFEKKKSRVNYRQNFLVEHQVFEVDKVILRKARK